jgi:TolB protein
MNADGTNQTRLTNDSSSDAFPKWSRDGRIIFTSDRNGQTGIYVMDFDGQKTTKLITMEAGQATSSPDGRKISFVATGLEKIAGHFQFQIFVVDADSSNVKMLTRSARSTFGPCWLPDSKSIAFNVDDMGVRSNIFQVDADGTNFRRLTAGPNIDTRPAFSPDGSKLAFQSNRDGDYEIYVMNLN